MKYRFASLIVAMAALALSAGAPAFGQAKSGYAPPKHPWEDHPDFDGIWQAKSNAGDDVEKLIVDPSNKKIPYLPAAVAQKNANAKNKAQADPVGKCFMPGIPRLMYMNYPFQIFQTEKYIMVVSEFAHIYRQIFMDGSKHLDDVPGGQWLGDSRGHWDGDSLVVDVIGFNDHTWFDKAGDYHSDQLHVEERYTRTAADTLTYEATITDPKTFSKPWKISVPLSLHKEPNFRVLEYECQDLAPPSPSAVLSKK
jgi:hypothetical protein